MLPWLLLAIIVLLTFANAFFVAAEFSLVSLERPAVEDAVAAGDSSAGPVLSALRSMSTQLSSAQIGITLTTLIVGYLIDPSIAVLLERPLQAMGVPASMVNPAAVATALVVVTAFSMIIGELLPQNLAISAPLSTARVVARPLLFFTAITMPLIKLLNGSANRFLRLLGVEPQEELSSARTPEELAALVERSARAGTLQQHTAELVTRGLDFGTRTAADVMTPRVRLQTVDRDATVTQLLALSRTSGHSRFPVIDTDVDDVAGVVHVKAALGVPRDRRDDVPVGALMVAPVRVPETVRLDPLLARLREQGFQVVIVLDEYGGTAGMVTLEDVVEEIVGEVRDEHDPRRPGIVRYRDGSLAVPGLVRPDELRDLYDIPLSDGAAYETLGGLVMAELGRLPLVGDEVCLPGVRLVVERLEGRRVDRLRVYLGPTAADGTNYAAAPPSEGTR